MKGDGDGGWPGGQVLGVETGEVNDVDSDRMRVRRYGSCEEVATAINFPRWTGV